jgi:hypothetical protein
VGTACAQVTARASTLGAAGRAARGGRARALRECGCWAWASACPCAIVRDVQHGGQRGWAGVHARAVAVGSARARANARGCARERPAGLARLLGRGRRAGCWAAEGGRGKVELGQREERKGAAWWRAGLARRRREGWAFFPFSPIFFIFSSFLFLSLLFI